MAGCRSRARRVRSLLAVLALVAFVIACASVTQDNVTPPPYVIEVAVLNTDGWPIPGAVLYAADGSYAEILLTGVVDLHVTGPVRLVAWKVQYAASEAVWCYPGECRITLQQLLRVND